MLKKSFIWLLVLCMALVVVPITALAGETTDASAMEVATGNVAKVGNTEYATIDEAIANWTNNTTLTLLSDVTLSDVVTLKSTEHHILDLGTYTMTAAEGKNAFVIQACGTGSSERTAITINADATNPGGINAGKKCVVYYKYADGGISTEDRPIIKINGGVFTGSTSSFGSAGIYTIGTAARKCATLNITGGTFNCSINGSGKSKLIISGGTFNYSVGSQGDSTALRLISGGTFKTFGFMTADSNNTKFWIGTSMGNSNVGTYIDDNGYLVVGGPVISEAGENFEASSPNHSNAGFSSYLTYSSAATNGIYYTSVEEALADNNKASGSVTVYVDELDMTGISYKGTIVVPAESTLTIKNAPADLKVTNEAGEAIVPNANGSYTTVEPPVKVENVDVTVTEKGSNSYDIVLNDGNAWEDDASVEMTFPAVEDATEGDYAFIIHEHEDGTYIYLTKVNANGKVVIENTVGFSTFTVYDGGLAEALAAAKTMTGDVTIEIYDKVTLAEPLFGSYDSIKFVGKDTDAEIYLDVQGYITATGKTVAFENLILSKSEGGFITNAGFMNVAFGVYDVAKVTYTGCTFANGAYASSGDVTFDGCTFYRSHDKYGLWAYGDVDVTVTNSTFADYRGIKMYAEDKAKTTELTVKNTDFSAVDGKPAIVLTYGESVTLEGNTYSATGVFELDLDGAPNGVSVTSDVAPTCVNDNGACGVLVDGKIYTTVAQAAEVAVAGSEVTLLHNSAETVKLAYGVLLEKNGYEAAGVTVAAPVAYIGEQGYANFADVLTAVKNSTGNVIKLNDNVSVSVQNALDALTGDTLDLNGYTLTVNGNSYFSDGTTTFKNGVIVVEGYASDSFFCGYTAGAVIVFDSVAVMGDNYKTGCAIFNANVGKIEIIDSEITVSGDTEGGVIYGGTAVISNSEITATNVCRGVTNSVATIENGTSFVFDGGETGLNNSDVTVDGSTVVIKNATKRAVRLGNNTLALVNGSSLTAENCAEDIVKYNENSAADVNVSEDSTLNAVDNVTVYVAEVNGVKYETLAEAFAAAQAGDTVALLGDVTVAEGETIEINGVNLIANGNKIVNNGTINVYGTVTLNLPTISGNAINGYNATLVDSTIGVGYYVFGTENKIMGTTTISGITSVGYYGGATEVVALTILGNFNGTNVLVSYCDAGDHVLYVGDASGARTTAHFGQLGTFGDAHIVNADVTYAYAFLRNDLTITDSTMAIKGGVNTYVAGNAKVVIDNSTWNMAGYANIGSYGGYMYGNADVTLKNGAQLTATNLGVELADGKTVQLTIEDNSGLTATNLTNQGTIVLASPDAKLTANECGNVISSAEDYKTVYENGEYKLVEKVYVAIVDGQKYETLSEALAAVTSDDQTVTILTDVTENLVGAYLRGNIVTENGAQVTITLTNSDWVYCPYTFVLGENITLKVPALFYYAGGAVINGTVIANAYYQRYAGTKLTINEPGSLTVNSEQFYLRYTDGDPNAGIYINGDNDDSTVGLKVSVVYFYQGTISAKDATIETSVYWQTQGTDGQGTANLVLDNSILRVTGTENTSAVSGNSTVTLTNNSKIVAAGAFDFATTAAISLDETSDITSRGVSVFAAKIGNQLYKTLGEAVAALADGETLVILKSFTAGANEFIELNGQKNITITAAAGVVINGDISIGYHASHIDSVDRSDSTLTIDGLTVNGTLTVCSNDASFVVSNNKAAQLTVKTYRVGMNISLCGNEIDGSIGAAANSYGMFIVPNATAYNLNVSGNTFENVSSHAFVIQGCGDGAAVTYANSISVTDNEFLSWGLGGKDDRAAFKIWADTKYAPASGSNVNETTNAMRELVNAIEAGNNVFASTADNTVDLDIYDIAADVIEIPDPVYEAEIDGVKYDTLEDAINAAQAGDTIVIIKDLSDVAVTVDKNLTIKGNVLLTNVSISGSTGIELAVEDLSFSGNSWINTNGAAKLTVKNVTADVAPNNASATNSRSAFISLGRSESAQLELYVEGCNIVCVSGSNPILGWAAITKADLINNIFGSASVYQNSGDSVKFMAIADGAVFNITGNTVYSNYNGIVFAQNTTRGNAYTANISGNTFIGGADHIWVEVSGSNTTHAKINASSDNTVNGNAFKATDIKLHPNLSNFTGYLGVDIEFNAENKIIGGSFVKVASAQIASGYEAVAEGGAFAIQKILVAEVNGVKYATLREAVDAVADGGTIVLLRNIVFDMNTRESSGGSWYEGIFINGDKSFTLDLAGYTITQDGSVNDYLITIVNKGAKANTITIKNGTLDAANSAYCALCTSSTSTQKITINLEGVKLINNVSNGSTAKIRGGAELNVKAGTVITGKNSYLAIECVASTVNIYDGAEIYMNGSSSYNGCLVGVCGGGVVNVYGGYGKGVKGGFIAMTSGGTINVYGGEWIANTDGSIGDNSNLYVLTAQNNSYESGYVGASIINVYGGIFRGGVDAWILNQGRGEVAELNIFGGNFNANPAGYVESGYVAAQKSDSTYDVAKAVAKIGDTYYATVQAAINAAQNGETVTILPGEYGSINISNKNITIQGTVGDNGELLTTIKGGNPAIIGHGFNGTIKDLKIVDAWKVMYAEPAGSITIDNVYVTGATYGFHLVAYSEGLTWTIQNSYMDLRWANSFGVYGSGDAAIVITGNIFEATNPYYAGGDVLHVNSFLPNVTVTENVFGENAKIRMEVTDASKINISKNYHADGVDNAFSDDSDVAPIILEYYTDEALTNLVKRIVKIGDVDYATLEEALAAIQAGETLTLLADITLTENLTLPAGIILNGNGKQINGEVWAGGDLTFVGHTKVTNFNAGYNKAIITISADACLELTGSGRMVIGHGATFNIIGTITDAKTANVADLTPSLILPGASFTGAGVTFNVTNAYIKVPSSYCSTSKSASGTFTFNITNSIWESAGKLAFEEQSTAATVNFNLKDSVLTTGSHLVFGVSKGEIVIDNSNVNVGTARQLENCSTMIIKNGSVVNGAVATSSNAKNPGTIIVDNATYAVTGEFSGSDLGTGTIIVKNGASVTIGSITKANIKIDATGMSAGDEINLTANLSKFAGTIEVINNDKLEAKIVDGKIVLSLKPVAKIGETTYTTLEDAFKAATDGCVIEILADVVIDYKWDCRDYATNGSHSQFKESVTINGNGHTIKFTGTVNDNNWNTIFRFEENATVQNLTVDISEATGAQRVISAKKSLTVDGLTIVGAAKHGIVFGEGASAADLAETEIVITNSDLNGTRRAISDNEGGKDVKSVTITNNILRANAYASAFESIIFNNNTAAGEVDLRSYTAADALAVEAKGNTLTEGVKNYIIANTIDAQNEFLTSDTVASVNGKYYSSFADAYAAANAGDTIEILANITADAFIAIDKSITINGNGHQIISSATRVFRVTASDIEVTLNNVNMVSRTAMVWPNDIRGISIDGSLTNVTLTLNNCSVDFTDASACDWAYAVNISGSGTGHVLTVNGGSYEGANVINVHGANNIVTVKNATITSLYPNSDAYYGAGIWVLQNQGSSVVAEGNTFVGNNAIAFNLGTGTDLTESNNTDNMTIVVAKIGGVYYTSLEDAFKAATDGCVIELLRSVTVDYYWDARNTGSKFTVPVTIDGNGHTIKFTNTVYDGGNFMSAFRFEADATVIDLTIDMSEALSGFGGRFRAISAKANLTVDGCTFIGNGSANNTRAIIFGEGAGANVGNVVVSITDSKFIGWRRAISDNENAQDAKAVTITGNTIEDANVGVSAAETVIFNDNTVAGGYVNIKSYVSSDTLSVTAQGNTLTANTVAGYNIISNANTVVAQNEFMSADPVAVINDIPYATLADALAAVQDGETIVILAGEHEFGSVKFPVALKNVTIKGADGKTTIVKNSLLYSADGNTAVYEGITFDGIVFDNSQIVFTGNRNGEVIYMDWTITNCEFKNIVSTSNAAVHFNLAADERIENFTFTNNVINGVTGGNVSGLRLNYVSGNVTIKDNVITGVAWNAIQMIHVNANTIVIEGNTLASGADEGLLNLFNVTASAITIKNNKFMVQDGQPGIAYIASADVSENYWGGNAPAGLPEGVIANSYYADEAMTQLIEAVVKLGDKVYFSLADALDAAVAGDTIKLVADVTYYDDIILTRGVTLDLSGYTLVLNSLIAFKDSSVIDNGATKGLLIVDDQDSLILSRAAYKMLPVWNEEETGFIFVNVKAQAVLEKGDDDFTLIYRPSVKDADIVNADIFGDGAADNGLTFIINIHCIKDGVARVVPFAISDELIREVYSAAEQSAIYFTIYGATDRYDEYKIEFVIVSGDMSFSTMLNDTFVPTPSVAE